MQSIKPKRKGSNRILVKHGIGSLLQNSEFAKAEVKDDDMSETAQWKEKEDEQVYCTLVNRMEASKPLLLRFDEQKSPPQVIRKFRGTLKLVRW